MFRPSQPHAGVLVDRFVPEEEAPALRDRAARLPQLALDERETLDLDLVASGAASPLEGFLGLRDYRAVLDRARLASGVPWPVPFTLAVTVPELAAVLRHGAAALRDARGRLRGVLTATDAFVRNPADEAMALHGTTDPEHPGVAYLLSRPTGAVGGTIAALPRSPGDPAAPSTPRAVRALARARRWTSLAGIGTVDGAGAVEGGGDEPAFLGIAPLAPRHAPGRDALLHAIVLANHGAREVFLEHDRSDFVAAVRRFELDDLGIEPVWLVGARPRPARATAEAHAHAAA